jgi:hypothetical protein
VGAGVGASARQATPLGGLLAEGEDEAANAAATVGAGEGTGEGPGWGDMDPELVARVVDVIERAQKTELAFLADEPTIQMRLSGQPADVVERWLENAATQLEILGEPVPDADVVEPEPEPEPAEADDEAQGRLG